MRIRYLKQEIDRHGKPRLYVRLPGRKLVRLPVSSIEDPGFGPAYASALNGEPVEKAVPKSQAWVGKALPGSLRELCVRYSEFLTKDTMLSERTKYIRRRHLEEVCRTIVKSPSGPRPAADMPVKIIGRAQIQGLLDRKRDKPEASNDRRKALVAVFKWAIPRGLADSNPAAETEKIRTHSEGFKPWRKEHVVRFVEQHPLGTKAYLALALLLYTGQRRADVVCFGRQHVKDGALHFVQQKNEKRLHKQMRIPILPALQEVLDTVPKTQMTFLVTEFGKPFTAAGFGNWFRDRCDQAGLKGLSAHGLRKTLLTIGAEMGLTAHELMAWAGHETTKETSRYTKKFDRDLLGESGKTKLLVGQFGNRIGAPEQRVSEKWAKNDEK
jgi:integrase